MANSAFREPPACFFAGVEPKNGGSDLFYLAVRNDIIERARKASAEMSSGGLARQGYRGNVSLDGKSQNKPFSHSI